MSAASLARLLELVPAGLRQYIPIRGLFAEDWAATTAIALYWFESLLLVLVAAALAWRLRRRVSDASIDAASARGDAAAARALSVEQGAANKAGLNPRDVLIFHLGSMFVFAGFLGGILVVVVGNGHAPPPDWSALRSSAGTMVLVVGLGFVLDLVLTPAMGTRAVQARVDACMARWGLLWLLGFGGTFAMVFTGRPAALFAWFAILKAIWEGWGILGRVLGWSSLADRKANANASEVDVE